VVGAVALVWSVALLRRSSGTGTRGGGRRWACLAGGVVALAAAITWPLADLASRWSLTALLGQRLLLTLAVAPLLLFALPTQVLARITRPAPLDAAVAFFTRPVTAVVTFSVIAVGTLASTAVAAQSSSVWARAGIDGLLLAGGAVLWGPVLHNVPGAYRPTPMGTAVYLLVQSIVPTFPAVVYIFSNHPIYTTFDSTNHALGMSAVGDQHLAGIVAKVATLPVLWTLAWMSLARAHSAEGEVGDPYTLTWAEVERQFQRAERAERRGRVRRERPRAIPRPVAGGWWLPREDGGLHVQNPRTGPPGSAGPPGTPPVS
jgi:cytochrome c oxidase assembly factor CtaG